MFAWPLNPHRTSELSPSRGGALLEKKLFAQLLAVVRALSRRANAPMRLLFVVHGSTLTQAGGWSATDLSRAPAACDLRHASCLCKHGEAEQWMGGRMGEEVKTCDARVRARARELWCVVVVFARVKDRGVCSQRCLQEGSQGAGSGACGLHAGLIGLKGSWERGASKAGGALTQRGIWLGTFLYCNKQFGSLSFVRHKHP